MKESIVNKTISKMIHHKLLPVSYFFKDNISRVENNIYALDTIFPVFSFITLHVLYTVCSDLNVIP